MYVNVLLVHLQTAIATFTSDTLTILEYIFWVPQFLDVQQFVIIVPKVPPAPVLILAAGGVHILRVMAIKLQTFCEYFLPQTLNTCPTPCPKIVIFRIRQELNQCFGPCMSIHL